MLEMIDQDRRQRAGGIYLRGHPDPLRAGRRHCQRAEQPRRQRRRDRVPSAASAGASPISGVARQPHQRTALGGMGRRPARCQRRQQRRPTALGQRAARRRIPTARRPPASTFQQRLLNSSINASGRRHAGQAGPIQIFGQAKIIADERSQLAARLCHAGGHERDQGGHRQTGRAALAGAHRGRHH